MTANDNKPYHGYLNKLADEYNNTYRCSISKRSIDADYSVLCEEIETNPKAPKFKVDDEVRITKYKNIFSKADTENWSRKIFVFDPVFRTNPWTYRIDYSKGQKIIGNFYEKELFLSKS